MSENGPIQDNKDAKNMTQAKRRSGIGLSLMELEALGMEAAWEAREKANAPNGMSYHEMMSAIEDEDLRAHMVEIMYPHLLREEKMSPENAERVLLFSARNLLAPETVRRAISRGAALAKNPEGGRQFGLESRGERHRKELEQAIRLRRSPVAVTFGIGEIDALIPGGVKAGEVLHIVGGEGGLKTSLLLHILCHYIDRGGRALFFSLDMTPATIELRRLMRLLNCTRERAMEHIKYDAEEYRRAKAVLEQQDENLFVMGGPLGLGKMRETILMSGADVVAIDYVTLVEGFKSELETAREVTRAARDWRKMWGVTFILLSQMSRESRRDASNGGTGGHGIGGSSLEQLVDYELELIRDEPLMPGDRPRLIATLRKNRSGPSGVSFEIFPCFPGLTFSDKAYAIEREKKRKPLFSAYLQ